MSAVSTTDSALSLPQPLYAGASGGIAGLGLNRSSSLLFVDRSVADYQQLVAGASPGTEVHILNSVQDAVTQITNTLLGRSGISSLQIVSHGESGGLDFGSSRLTLSDLPGYAAQVQSWGQALTDDADILLYGCDVASGELGQAFVQILSQLTGADVAASDNLTGQGGDWVLEYQTGSIESASGLQERAMRDFRSSLGTSQVGDINPGSSDSYPGGFTAFNNALYFTASTPASGSELYKVDSSGVVSQVNDINPGSSGSNPGNFTAFNNALYFTASIPASGFEVYKVDSSGVVSQVNDINPGSNSSNPGGFTAFNNALYFAASTPASGSELYKVDSSGVVSQVNDINPGSNSSNPGGFTAFNNALYFTASTPASGRELWKFLSPDEVSLSTTTPSIAEGSPGIYTLTRGVDVNGDLSVKLTIDGTSSVTSGDYTLSGASVTISGNNLTVVIPNGQSSVTLNLAALTDSLLEPTETLKLNLVADAAYTLGSSTTAAIAIADSTTLPPIVTPPVTPPVAPLAASPIFTVFQLKQTFTLNKATQKLLSAQPPGLQQLFDEEYYLNKNADVAAAVARGGLQSGFQHFLSYGQYEGRNPSALYNEQYYLSQNADVAAAVTRGNFRCGFQHFLQFGEYEGRNFSTLFNEQTYLSQNTDVAVAVAKGGFRSGIQHFLQFGFSEGRLTSLTLFNEQYYLSQNSDVAAAVARGLYKSGLQHFEQYGQREGRQPSPLFNDRYYLSQNSDVAAAVAQGQYKSGFEHYLDFGRFEGRGGIG